MTLPRELKIKGNHVYQLPVKEIEKYRINEVTYNCIQVQEEQSLDEVKGRTFDLSLRLKKLKSDYCFTMNTQYTNGNNTGQYTNTDVDYTLKLSK